MSDNLRVVSESSIGIGSTPPQSFLCRILFNDGAGQYTVEMRNVGTGKGLQSSFEGVSPEALDQQSPKDPDTVCRTLERLEACQITLIDALEA